MTDLPLPACPRCGHSDRVDRIDPPKHDTSAINFCDRCNLPFNGTRSEAFEVKAKDAAKAAARGDLARHLEAGRQHGVIGKDQP